MIVVNIGDLLVLLAVPFIQTNGANYYFIAYLVATSMLILSLLLFIIGNRYCTHVKPYDLIITNCIPVVISAFQSWYQYKREKYSMYRKTRNPSLAFLRTTSSSFDIGEGSLGLDQNLPTFLDFAKVINNGKFQERIVDDVNAFRRAIIVFTLLIPYWLIYDQVR